MKRDPFVFVNLPFKEYENGTVNRWRVLDMSILNGG